MRNLRYLRLNETRFSDGLPLTGVTWDPSSDSAICCFGPTPQKAVIELKRWTPGNGHDPKLDLVAAWDAPCPLPDLDCDKVLSLQYFADVLTSCLILVGGDIIVVREEPQPGEEKIEIVGSVDVGISAAAWAPDEELVALTTRASTLLYMTRDFDNVAVTSLSVEDLNASKHVSVGWGKAETQFKGKRAKILRDPTIPEKIDEGKISSDDAGKVSITWRGDGKFLAVNSIESGLRRVIRVFSREGTLDSASEPVDGLTEALSWRPAGNIIASVQRFTDRIDVVFFERNGLRHGQFSLRLTEEDMKTWASDIQLHWNISSSVLAILFRDRVQLWTMGNYHYYLKQEIPLTMNGESKTSVICRWHSEKQFRIAMASAVNLLDTEFAFEAIRGSTVPPNDHGTVAVIDGRRLKLTPLTFAVIPPPMGLWELELEENIIDVSISASGTRIAVMSQKNFKIFHYTPTSRPFTTPSNLKVISLSKNEMSPTVRIIRISFLGDESICILGQDSGLPVVFKMSISTINEDQNQSLNRLYFSAETLFPAADITEVYSAQHELDQSKGRVFTIRKMSSMNADDHTHNSAQNLESLLLSCPPSKFAVRDIAGVINGDAREMPFLIFLTKGGKLSIDDHLSQKKVISANVNSFAVTSDHLIFTTTRNLIKFVHIRGITSASELEVPPDTPEEDERCRSVENGATIVTTCPSTFKVILQVPRGNLEAIYPRALVVAGIRRCIDGDNYKAAFKACRKHMVDMNILHDYDPLKFMSMVETFLGQLKKGEFIDEFLIRLKEEDVCQTLYRDTVQRQPSNCEDSTHPTQDPSKSSNKVNNICDAMIRALTGKLQQYAATLVTAYVSKRPPDIDSAMRFIKDLMVKQKQDLGKDALERICYLVDKNKLFDSALGLYDLELAVTVARESQKDPKEYLPWIKGLKEESEYRAKFMVDDHLKRYERAISHLFQLGALGEMLQYTVKHELYNQALQLFRLVLPEYHEKTLALYAEHLFGRSQFREAAIVYEAVRNYSKASEAYAKANLWRESLNSASLSSDSTPGAICNLASSLAIAMVQGHDCVSAATIYADYLNDVPQAARLLCEGYRFVEATSLLLLRDARDHYPSVVDTGLANALASTIELLAECKGQLNAQLPRIRELRVAKAADPVSFLDNAGNNTMDGIDVPDNVSIAPTDASTAGASLFTRYTNSSHQTSASRQTSRSRRREERKRAKGKRGTVYEEEYLVASVGRLIDRINTVNEDVGRLVAGLASRGKGEEAKTVRNAMEEVVGLCRGSLEEVFQAGKTVSLANDERPSGGDGVVFDSLEEQEKPTEPTPVVRDFEKFPFLG